MELERLIRVAAGREPADLVLKNGYVVNVLSDEIQKADVALCGKNIAGIGSYDGRTVVDLKGQYICPGFIDGHIHIESSMLSVPEFAKVTATHGTTAVVTDPHEIANVLGIEGIRYMLASSKYCPIRVYVMLSACVPASALESAGAQINAVDLLPMLTDEWTLGLAEVMNYPGVLALDPQMLDKLKVAQERKCVIDGHAPGLTGRPLQAYIAAGIRSDHESTTLDEAREKLRLGMYVMIREGSQAQNLDALLPLVTPTTSDRFLFVTDDCDVEDLLDQGHMDYILRRAISKGLQPTLAVKMTTYNTARYFGLKDYGAVAPGFRASLTILNDLKQCRVTRVYQDGQLVAQDGACIPLPQFNARHQPVLRSTMNTHWLEPHQFAVKAPDSKTTQRVHVIEMIANQLVTQRRIEEFPVREGQIHADPTRDLVKAAVIERHLASGNMGLGFISGLGLQRGAIASSVAHDAHNIIVAGTNDKDMYAAAVAVIKMRGGLCAVLDGKVLAGVPLPIAGLMSDAPALEVHQQLDRLHHAATTQLGCKIRRPFMAMSFLALSVIGSLKITDRGLIDVDRFQPIPLFVSS